MSDTITLHRMAKQKQEPFSDREKAQVKHFGEALLGEPTDFDEEMEKHLADHYPHEAGFKKMRAAQTGGSLGLGPTAAEQAQVGQRETLRQQSAAAGAQQAAQAQGQQASVAPPPAPTGPQGTTAPYSAQKGAVGGSGTVETPAAPAAPGPQTPKSGPEQEPEEE
jgi:hypothetical protein